MAIDGFGGTEVLYLADLPVPTPGAGEVLVKIFNAGVNPSDWKAREGKLAAFFDYQFPFVIGFDLGGVVEAVGPGVERWKAGDRVFGMSNQKDGKDGTYAEYCIASEGLLAPLPTGWSYAEAAAIPVPGSTAYGSLVDAGELKPGQTVLINGGAGGVGSIGTQIARAFDARVAVTCIAADFDYVLGLGVERPIDYQNEDVVAAVREWAPDGVDLVVDAVGLGTLTPKALQIVKPGGSYVEIETLISRVDEAFVANAAAHGVRVVSSMIAIMRQPQHFAALAELCDEGKVRPPLVETMPLEHIGEAHRRLEAGTVRGKLVLDVQ